jgi:aspartate/glutamate racemase
VNSMLAGKKEESKTMDPEIVIRKETDADVDAITEVTIAAFKTVEILGCTELPLILNQDEFGIPFLNTTAIHAESIVRYCIGKET